MTKLIFVSLCLIALTTCCQSTNQGVGADCNVPRTLLRHQFLSELGYIAVLPDSYAIPGRKVYCDIKNKKLNALNKHTNNS